MNTTDKAMRQQAHQQLKIDADARKASRASQHQQLLQEQQQLKIESTMRRSTQHQQLLQGHQKNPTICNKSIVNQILNESDIEEQQEMICSWILTNAPTSLPSYQIEKVQYDAMVAFKQYTYKNHESVTSILSNAYNEMKEQDKNNYHTGMYYSDED